MSMEITLKILGKRLKEYRIHLGLKQNDIAKMLQINQNAISRIENGICGGIESYLSLINYFSQYFVIDNLFNVHFHVIEKNANNNLDSIAI